MAINSDERPRLIKTDAGFTVVYRGRYLYSKYEPAKTVTTAIEKLSILPRTLILACSPCLCLGLKELFKKLPENCLVLGCEKDENLYELCATSDINNTQVSCQAEGVSNGINNTQKSCQTASHEINNFLLLEPRELDNLPFLLTKRNAVLASGARLPAPGTFRRIIRIDFSAGTQFFAPYYNALTIAAENAIARFWKNRATLVKLGRKFSRNLFRNLAHYAMSEPLEMLARSVSKPILVLGAGESMETTARLLINNGEGADNASDEFYIIAADTALSPLLARGISPDAVVCEEAQIVIASAFFSMKENTCVFAGITSWTGLFDECKKSHRTAAVQSAGRGNIRYFATRYDDTAFFDSLVSRGILPPVMPPLGSVGLSAVRLALMLRASERVPVFVSGLDFSYSIGKTHTNGAPAHKAHLINTTRTKSIENYDAAFGIGARQVRGKNGKAVYTTPALLSYAETFRAVFADVQNLFDVGKTGLELDIARRDFCDFIETINNNKNDDSKNAERATAQNEGARQDMMQNAPQENALTKQKRAQKINDFYDEEEAALRELKTMLSQGRSTMERACDERDKKIVELLRGREYLYLHFPDGWKLSLEPSFLARVRAEIDFFLKDITVGKRLLAAHVFDRNCTFFACD